MGYPLMLGGVFTASLSDFPGVSYANALGMLAGSAVGVGVSRPYRVIVTMTL